MAELMLYQGGPKDAQVLPGEPDQDQYLAFARLRAWAWYRATDETAPTPYGTLRIARYIGDRKP